MDEWWDPYAVFDDNLPMSPSEDGVQDVEEEYNDGDERANSPQEPTRKRRKHDSGDTQLPLHPQPAQHLTDEPDLIADPSIRDDCLDCDALAAGIITLMLCSHNWQHQKQT